MKTWIILIWQRVILNKRDASCVKERFFWKQKYIYISIYKSMKLFPYFRGMPDNIGDRSSSSSSTGLYVFTTTTTITSTINLINVQRIQPYLLCSTLPALLYSTKINNNLLCSGISLHIYGLICLSYSLSLSFHVLFIAHMPYVC